MTKIEQIREMLAAGTRPRDIATALGMKQNNVNHAIWTIRHPEENRFARMKRRRLNGVRPIAVANAERRKTNAARNATVIAAVRAGLTYSETAKKCGLPSRSAVAGIVNRMIRQKMQAEA